MLFSPDCTGWTVLLPQTYLLALKLSSVNLEYAELLATAEFSSLWNSGLLERDGITVLDRLRENGDVSPIGQIVKLSAKNYGSGSFISICSGEAPPSQVHFLFTIEEIENLPSVLESMARFPSIAIKLRLIPDETSDTTNHTAASVFLCSKILAGIRDGSLANVAITNVLDYLDNLSRLKRTSCCNCSAGGTPRVRITTLDSEEASTVENDSVCPCMKADPSITSEVIAARTAWMRDRHPECSTCPFFGFCGGTCAARALELNGDINTIDPVECAVRKFFYADVIEEFARTGASPLRDYWLRHHYSRKPKSLFSPEQDAFVRDLPRRAGEGADPAKLARDEAERYREFATRAWRIAREALGRINAAPDGRLEFENRFLDALADFMLNTSTLAAELPYENAPDLPRTLYVSWHFPEYPLGVPEMIRRNALQLVARHAGWMDPMAAAGCMHVFKTDKQSSAIPRAFREGRAVFAMMDYFYEGGVNVEADFFGLPARVPAGVLKLAERFDYRVCFLSKRPGCIAGIDEFSVKATGIEAAARRINARLEAEILRDPARWLLWPNAASRWPS